MSLLMGQGQVAPHNPHHQTQLPSNLDKGVVGSYSCTSAEHVHAPASADAHAPVGAWATKLRSKCLLPCSKGSRFLPHKTHLAVALRLIGRAWSAAGRAPDRAPLLSPWTLQSRPHQPVALPSP